MKCIKIFIVISILFICSSFSENIMAEMQPGMVSINPHIGGYAFSESKDINNSVVYGLGIGINLTRKFGLEGSFDYMNTDSTSSGVDISIPIYRVDALYHFQTEKKLVPFISAGFGTIDIQGTGVNNTDNLMSYGGGIKYFITKSLALRGDIRHILEMENTDRNNLIDFNDISNNVIYTLGLNYMFSINRKKTTPPPVDSDGDGVNDDRDRCPDTPPGVPVDNDGCPKDSDGDGVNDDRDRCPDTPAGVPVDSDGCPKDSDGDGVNDDRDRCPDTPAGVPVDSDGCPRDSDGDGVYDYLDECPDTLDGVKVDEKGCAIMVKEKVSIELRVEFEFDSAVIKETHRDDIRKLAEFLKTYPETKAVIEGHTCNIGTEQYNLKLSLGRAESVRQRLAEYGIDSSRLEIIGLGETVPSADNKTEEGRKKNRRVFSVISTTVTKYQNNK
jgi:OOP family OmpA-OmpF porin